MSWLIFIFANKSLFLSKAFLTNYVEIPMDPATNELVAIQALSIEFNLVISFVQLLLIRIKIFPDASFL
jgi:hypothetical protein